MSAASRRIPVRKKRAKAKRIAADREKRGAEPQPKTASLASAANKSVLSKKRTVSTKASAAVTKKPISQKTAKTSAAKSPAKKTAAKKIAKTTKKAPSKKTSAKLAAKKPAAKTTKKTTASKTTTKKASSKKTSAKLAAKKTSAKPAAKKAVAAKRTAKKAAATKKVTKSTAKKTAKKSTSKTKKAAAPAKKRSAVRIVSPLEAELRARVEEELRARAEAAEARVAKLEREARARNAASRAKKSTKKKAAQKKGAKKVASRERPRPISPAQQAAITRAERALMELTRPRPYARRAQVETYNERLRQFVAAMRRAGLTEAQIRARLGVLTRRRNDLQRYIREEIRTPALGTNRPLRGSVPAERRELDRRMMERDDSFLAFMSAMEALGVDYDEAIDSWFSPGGDT